MRESLYRHGSFAFGGAVVAGIGGALYGAGYERPGIVIILIGCLVVLFAVLALLWDGVAWVIRWLWGSRRRSDESSVRLSVVAKSKDGQVGFGRSVDGRLSTALVDVEITAKNMGTSNVRISNLRCELYRRRFGFWVQRVETLPFFHTYQLDWLLLQNALPETRPVTFSRHNDYPWSYAKVPIGQELIPRVVAEFSGGQPPWVTTLPKIIVQGPYSPTSA